MTPPAQDERRTPPRWVVLLLILASTTAVIYGGWLRVSSLDAAPLHADEAATGAKILSMRLEGEGYTFDPRHYHGPLLTSATIPLAKMRGETTWESLSKQTLRVVPVVFSGLTALLILAMWPTLRWGAVVAAAWFATSPLLVYFNRIYIHETLQVFAAAMFLTCGLAYAAKPRWPKAILCGLALGLMASNKETAAISVFSWCVAGVALAAIYGRSHIQPMAQIRRHGPAVLAAVITALVVMTMFYTDLGRHPAGIVDFFKTYIVYENKADHAKPASYYGWLLAWPKFRGGLWWGEGLLLLAAIFGAVLAFRGRYGGAVRFLALAALIEAAVYTCIGYKTPWLMMVCWLQVCLVAGYGVTELASKRSFFCGGLAVAFLGGALYWQAEQAGRAAHRFPVDERNPYAYVPTSKDIEKLQRWLEDLAEAYPVIRNEPLAVVGNQYWPLPWYLRSFERVGYWPELPGGATDFPLIISLPDLDNTSLDALAQSHDAVPRSLRPDTLLLVHVRKDIWADYLNPERTDD
ncbi:MAG: flippase activity-associated protein Agl23 [Planctomycetota bacterium]